MSMVGRHIQRACANRLRRRFVSAFFNEQEGHALHEQAMLADAGVTLDKVVKVRPDTSSVLLVRHPEHGRCVLKTTFALRRPHRGLARLALAKVVSEPAGRAIFPRVFAATPDYTLEQYIDGTAFRQWMSESFNPGSVQDYLQRLKQWSVADACWSGPTYLAPYEIRELCQSYIAKCLNHVRFASTADHVRCLSHFASDGRDIEAQVQWLHEASEAVQIPRAITCGDMGNINIIVQRDTQRLFNVDYEYMGSGHWGFDCGYFIASLEKMGDAPAAVKQIREMVLCETYLDTAECREFFTVYTDLLSAISRAVYARC